MPRTSPSKTVRNLIAAALFVLVGTASSSVQAWTIVNDTPLALDVTVHVPVFGEIQSSSLGNGGSIICPWYLGECNPPIPPSFLPERDSSVRFIFTSDDGQAFRCVVNGLGDALILVQGQSRVGLGVSVGTNYYCSAEFNETQTAAPPPIGLVPWIDYNGNGIVDTDAFVDSSDPFAGSDIPGNIPPMTETNRHVRFLASGDPQYNNSDIDGDGNTSGDAAQSDATLMEIVQRTRDDLSIRGVIVNGDLTQNARGDDGDIDVGKAEDELNAYKFVVAPEQHMFFEGLGNHDVVSTGGSSDVGDMRQFVREKPRNTVDTLSTTNGHYSWDWHDVHFVQLNVFPANEPSSFYPDIDPQSALDFLAADLALMVGTSGRPVVLNHHYGFDSFSTTGGSNDDPWWNEQERTLYWNAIREYNIVAIFTGHNHQAANSASWIHPFHQPDPAAAFPFTPLSRPDGRTCLPTFNGAAVRSGAFLDVVLDGSTVSVNRRSATGTDQGTVTYEMDTFDIPTEEDGSTASQKTVFCPEPGMLTMLLPGLGLLASIARRGTR
jgi:hypothetical protein